MVYDIKGFHITERTKYRDPQNTDCLNYLHK